MNEHLNSFYQKAREHNDIANDLFRKYDIKKGLRNEDGTGVRVGLTKIADVVGYKYVEEVKTDDIGKLYYRGIELRDIIHGRNYYSSAIFRRRRSCRSSVAICVRIMSCRMTFWNPNFCICREKI